MESKMEIYDNKALLINTRRPELVLDTIPKSKLVKEYDNGISQIAVHWGLEEVIALSDLKIKNAPSPISKEYNWPGVHKPFDHQRTTAEFLSAHRRAYCLSEAGTGKTSAVIWAADYLMNKKIINRMLVVCPLSIMEAAWMQDFFKTAMHRTVGIAHGSAEKRKKIFAEMTEVVIINYDGIEIVSKEIKEGGFDLVVVDEANYVKTSTTSRWKALNKILTKETFLWLMTGTPAAQSPADAYGLAKLVDATSVPRHAGTFKDQVMQKISQFTWVPRPNAQDIVFRTLQPAIRYTKAECLDLPSVLYTTREVEMTAQQKKYYAMLKKEMYMQASGQEVTVVNAGVMMTKLLQVSAGSIYSDNREVVEFDVSNRMNVLKEIISEASHKVLVFAPFRHSIEHIMAELNKQNISCEAIHGDISMGKRGEIFKRFQETKTPQVLVIQPQAASHGVTLHAANVVVFWSPVMSVETYIQCCARVDRAGQRNPMTVVHIQGSPVERRIYHMLQNKIDIHGKLVDLYKESFED
jgi:SNF2 family DNA or RNA helicase